MSKPGIVWAAVWLLAVGGCSNGAAVVATDAGMQGDSAMDAMTTCVMPQVACGTSCVDTQSDGANCGTCGHACGDFMGCNAGVCQQRCPTGQTVCGGQCVNLQTDNAHCGLCTTACATGQVCSMGHCGTSCDPSLALCGGAGDGGAGDGGAGGTPGAYCTDTRTDRLNCGACGMACPAGNVCVDRHCQVSCVTGQTACTGQCVNLQTDSANCGACGTLCPTGTVCAASACAVACGTGLTVCGGACANVQTDNANCGACGTACPAGTVCSAGACGATCATPLATCAMGAMTFCANTAIDPANCGSCGRACALPSVATQGCTGGACSIVRCNAGTGDCDGMAANGCETSTLTSTANCGACGHACALPNATSACTAGACTVTACNMGYTDCNHDPSDGCEVNTRADNANCGACGTSCPAGAVCSAGACGTTCAAPLATCGTAPTAFCANTALDPANCGACGHACTLANAATNGCAAGACTVVGCTMGFGDCDGMAANGCETSTLTSAANCGACGHACALPNATSACTAGACTVTTCNAGYADCNHDPADGCEVNTRTDNASCGGCGTSCPAGSVCSGGTCGTTCAAPLTTCGTAPATFCASTANDPANCGACGHGCALPGVAVDGCLGGACTVTRCNPGAGDCDGTATNGCEANTQTDNANCGACGHACALPNATAGCAGGACTITACTTGSADCDRTAANGCEVNTQTDNANCGGCSTVCPAGQACVAGACIVRCPGGQSVCGSACVNTATDNANCGVCGRACAAGSMCAAGVCSTTCAAPLTTCGSPSVCTNTAIDPAHCGTCAMVCPAVANAVSACAGGRCGYICNAGAGDCNGIPTDGCETDLTSSATRCGSCGNVCSRPNTAVNTCVAGACAVGTCATGFADCNHTASDGCEVNTQSDATNCGACGTVCSSGVCTAGVCGGGNKIVFASSVMYTGNFGGLAGADSRCQGLATAAGLPGTYRAWLSDDTTSAASRLTHSTGPYVLVDGTVVAANWTALTSGTLAHTITMTELRGAIPVGNTSCAGGGYPTVWSDTASNGSLLASGCNCGNWMSSTTYSCWGLANNTMQWSSWCSGGLCSWVSPLYCFQQ